MKADPHKLNRFVTAQQGIFEQVLTELKNGQKRTHWMWFIFPQIAGLGFSPTAQHYAIKSSTEAQAYLAHPVLGARLLQCVALLLALEGKTVSEIFGFPDDLKLKSSMTLFATVAGPDSDFNRVLDKYFAGQHDEKTVSILARSP